MKLTHRKNCCRCKIILWETPGGTFQKTCGLGYNIEWLKDGSEWISKPIENCPKPTTYKEYSLSKRIFKKKI